MAAAPLAWGGVAVVSSTCVEHGSDAEWTISDGRKNMFMVSPAPLPVQGVETLLRPSMNTKWSSC